MARQTRLARESKKNATTPGDPVDTKSFLACHENETLSAAYLGCPTVQDFRKLVVCPEILEAFTKIEMLGVPSKATTILIGILDHLRGPRDITAPFEKAFPQPLTDSDGEQERYARFSFLIIHAASKLEKARNDKAFDETIRNACEKSFLENKRVADNKITSLPEHGGQFPIFELGPFREKKESVLEKYNRVFVIIRHLRYRSNVTKWKHFSDPKSWSAITAIKETNRPLWMRDGENTAQPKIFLNNLDGRSEFTIQFFIPPGSQLDDDLKAMKCKLNTQQEQIGWPVYHPEHCAFDQFRDGIRRQMDLHSQGFKLDMIALKFTDNSQVPVPFYPSAPGRPSWSAIQSMFSANQARCMFVFEVEVVDEDEWDTELYYESPDFEDHLDKYFRHQPSQGRTDGKTTEDETQPLEDQSKPPKDEVQPPNPEKSNATEELHEVENKKDVVVKKRAHKRQAVKATPDAQEELYRATKILPDAPLGRRDFEHQFTGLSEETIKARHDGFNVEDPEQRKQWQKHFFRDYVGASKTKGRFEHTGGEAAEEKADVQASLHKFFNQDLDDLPADDAKILEASKLQNVFSGSRSQMGPCIKVAAAALGFEEWHPKEPTPEEQASLKVSTMYKTVLIPDHPPLWGWQVNGLAWMLIRCFGQIPAFKFPASFLGKQETQAALSNLKGHQKLGGCFVLDQTGLGKTKLLLSLLRFFNKFGDGGSETAEDNYKITQIHCPANLIIQWAREIDKFGGFNLVIAFGSYGTMPDDLRSRVLSRKATEALPDIASKHIPDDLKKYMDPKSPETNNTILLTSYESGVARQMDFEESPRQKSGLKKVKTTVSLHVGCAGMFKMLVGDESHAWRNNKSLRHAFARVIQTPYLIGLTATLMQHSVKDAIPPLMLLYDRAVEALPRQYSDIAKSIRNYSHEEFWKYMKSLSPDHTMRVLALDPKRLEWLLCDETNRANMAEYFPIVEDLCMLKRTGVSQIPLSSNYDFLDMREIGKGHTIKTLSLQFTPEEEQWYQHLHAKAAEKFDRLINLLRGGKAQSMSERPSRKADKKHFRYPVAELRSLRIASSSVQLAKFDERLKEVNLDTKVARMQRLRAMDRLVQFFIEIIHDPDRDASLHDRADELKFLSWGSPSMRFIFRLLLDTVLHDKTPSKLLVCEATPIVAMFYEMVLRHAYIDAKVIHADLAHRDREELCRQFREEKECTTVLIIMYDVSSQGLNLQHQCHTAFMAFPARSYSQEAQGFGRIIRANQSKKVQIYRNEGYNSHHGYWFSRQADRVIVELATRAERGDIQLLIVQYLNERNEIYERFLSTTEGRAAMNELLKKIGEGDSRYVDPATFGKAAPHFAFDGAADCMSSSHDSTATKNEEHTKGDSQVTGREGPALSGTLDQQARSLPRPAPYIGKSGRKSVQPVYYSDLKFKSSGNIANPNAADGEERDSEELDVMNTHLWDRKVPEKTFQEMNAHHDGQLFPAEGEEDDDVSIHSEIEATKKKGPEKKGKAKAVDSDNESFIVEDESNTDEEYQDDCGDDNDSEDSEESIDGEESDYVDSEQEDLDDFEKLTAKQQFSEAENEDGAEDDTMENCAVNVPRGDHTAEGLSPMDKVLLAIHRTDVYRRYTVSDLSDWTLVAEGLRLLYNRRMGRLNDSIANSIHIHYSQLTPERRSLITHEWTATSMKKAKKFEKDLLQLYSTSSRPSGTTALKHPSSSGLKTATAQKKASPPTKRKAPQPTNDDRAEDADNEGSRRNKNRRSQPSKQRGSSS